MVMTKEVSHRRAAASFLPTKKWPTSFTLGQMSRSAFSSLALRHAPCESFIC